MGIFGLLFLLRGGALRLCKRGEAVATWYSIIGRALAKIGTFFMVTTAARLVIGYGDTPPVIRATIVFLFTIVAAFQVAIWRASSSLADAREKVAAAVLERFRKRDIALAYPTTVNLIAEMAGPEGGGDEPSKTS